MAIPAEAVARMLLIAHAKNKDYEDGFCAFAKFDAETLRKLSGRKKLTNDFFAELGEAFADIGWHFDQVYNEEHTFCIFYDTITEEWDNIDAGGAADLARLWDGKISGDEAIEKVDEKFVELYGVGE